jgi:hypothetical protein
MDIKRQSEPGMRDPADKELHKREGRDPYPTPRKGARDVENAEDDLTDPAEVDPDAPHDRGVTEDGEYLSARDQMDVEIGKDKEAWRKGRTQNSSARDS